MGAEAKKLVATSTFPENVSTSRGCGPLLGGPRCGFREACAVRSTSEELGYRGIAPRPRFAMILKVLQSPPRRRFLKIGWAERPR